MLEPEQITLINSYLKQNKDPQNLESEYNDFLNWLSPSFRSVVNRRNLGIFILMNPRLSRHLLGVSSNEARQGLQLMSGFLIPKLYAPLTDIMKQDTDLSIANRFLHFIVHGSVAVSVNFKDSLG